jgi:cysteinyl-tRNA synthetase
MSKSSGEFLTVSLLESKGYDPLVYRLFCLQSHYRKSLVFSYENLDNAAIAYKKLVAKIVTLLKDEQGEIDEEVFKEHRDAFCAALDNDLNTSLAITALYNVLKASASAATKIALINDFDKVLGLDLVMAAKKALDAEEAAKQTVSDDPFIIEIEQKIAERIAAKKAKNYALADAIREELNQKGVTLIDTPQGTKYQLN